jgi:hypothetical protein
MANLYDDPAYQAFLRQSQLQTQTGLLDAARQQAALNQILQVQLPGLQRDQGQQQRDLTNSAAARGISRSGEYLRNASQLADQQGRQQSALVSQAAGGIGDLGASLAQNIATQQANQAEQALASQNTLNKAQNQGAW